MRTHFHIILLLITVGLCSGCIKWNDLWGVEDVSNKKQQALVAVDLGLPSGTLWASQNLLALHPWDEGGKFAWGETVSREWSDSKDYSFIVDGKLTAYNFDAASGVVDNRYILDPQDDAATVLLGGDWRMPTRWEFEELLEYCTWSSEVVIGAGRGSVQGFVVSSKVTSNYIILPSSTRSGGLFIGGVPQGYDYWTNCVSGGNAAKAFQAEKKEIISESRYLARYIRPVSAKRIPLESFSLDQEIPPFTPGETYQMNAEFSPSNAFDKHIFWKIDNKEVAELTWEGKLTPIYPGTATITATSPSTGLVETVEITVTDYVVPNKVDMGLPSGNLWADRNLGAIEEDDMGLFFAWGEIRPKTTFYNNYSGITSMPEIGYLPPEYDAASSILGEGWSFPTPDDCTELLDNCEVKHVPPGVWVLTSKITGNTIHLPSWWGYWTSYYWYNSPQVFAFSYHRQEDESELYTISFSQTKKNSEIPVRPVFKNEH